MPYNLLVVICHDLGRHLGCYGVPGVRSPNLDAFAASGLRFANHFCAAPQCSPSRAALWTGRYPHANGVVGLTHSGFANDLHPNERHFAQMLTAAGYETHLFGIQHESPRPERCGYIHIHPQRLCGELATDACDFLAGRRPADRPFFAQIGFIEPHRNYPHADVTPLPPAAVSVPPYLPDIPEVRADLADFEASIASADQAFGRILEAVRASAVAADTIVIFTADHGIPYPHAKMTLYDPGIEVPLLVDIPGVPGGRVVREMLPNVDVLPTLLELLGLPIPANLHGRSFAGLISGAGYTPHDAIFAEKTYHTYYDPMRCIRTDAWKLIANFEFAPYQETSPDYDSNARSYVEIAKALAVPPDGLYHPPFELYDVRRDPLEQNNLADSPAHRSTRDALIQRLQRWMQDTQDPLLDGPMAQGAYLRRMATFREIGGG